jgi:hypothetical protein
VRRAIVLAVCLAFVSVTLDAARQFGVANDERIVTSMQRHYNEGRTYQMWFYRTGPGGGGFGRMFDKGQLELLQYDASVNSIAYNRGWSVETGRWRFTAPPANEWHSVIVTYNGLSAGNHALMYLDGVQQTTNSPTLPSGTIVDNTTVYMIGNRSSLDRVWAGRLAEFAIWDRILSPAEIAALGNCTQTALDVPSGRVSYIPILGLESPEPDIDMGTSATVFGTTYADHPPACTGADPAPSLPCTLALVGAGKCE